MWFEIFGRASLVLVGVAFILSLVILVLWQVKLILRFGRHLDEERRHRPLDRQTEVGGRPETTHTERHMSHLTATLCASIGICTSS
jgi:hypothetical protein